MTISENVPLRHWKSRPAAAVEGQLTVSESASSEDLHRLLESLAQEDCAHSWRNFTPDGTVAQLLEWENSRRPTKLFFFYLHEGGTTHLVAASAVADRLNKTFPHTGFPVLGRCCILPEYRSRGFYRPVLEHRLEYCRAQYGSALNAIHIGAVNERISRVITDHGLPGWPRFIHMGEEALNVAGHIRHVGAYLLLMPHYLQRMLEVLDGVDAPAPVIAMRNALAKAENDDTHNLGLLIKDKYAEARQTGWFDTRSAQDIEQLLLFCESVPVVGFR